MVYFTTLSLIVVQGLKYEILKDHSYVKESSRNVGLSIHNNVNEIYSVLKC